MNGMYNNLDTESPFCREILDILLAKGVKDVVLSPGSRNAPLLIGAACRPFKHHIVPDERTAGFIALGIAANSQRPVALFCTSGTALYNYTPAVAEAMYQAIPLIIVSADRPVEWIDQDDSQTLRQPEALHNIVKASFNIPVDRCADGEMMWYVNRTVNEAINIATSGINGPVHINVQLDNPLTGMKPYVPKSPRLVQIIDDVNLQPHIVKQLASELSNKRVLLTVGFMPPSHLLNKVLDEFSSLPNVWIFAETLSNLHLASRPYEVDSILSWLEENQESSDPELLPDVVISIGGALVSRKLKEFIRNAAKQKSIEHWTLADTRLSVDCFRSLSRHIDVSPQKFFKGILKHLRKSAGAHSTPLYSRKWKHLADIACWSASEYIREYASTWCELTAFHHILNTLPASWNLFSSNGTPVRYAQLFTSRIPHGSYSNRGVSGIDGTSATAAGMAINYKGSTLLITGDISFSYCPEILGLKEIPDRFKIILINNRGGGIFRFLPSTRGIPQREDLFCTDPEIPAQKLAHAYGWEYGHASSITELTEQLDLLFNSPNKRILELSFDPNLSADILAGYFKRK